VSTNRNTEATCGNCPYFSKEKRRESFFGKTESESDGECRLRPIALWKMKDEWCGEHPDFDNWDEVAEEEEGLELESNLDLRELERALDKSASEVKEDAKED